jgi:hypothetical protein
MVHHSATEDGTTVSWAAIEKFHREDPEHLWRDVGYHAGVELVTPNPDLAKYRYQALIGRGVHDLAAACPQGRMNEIALHVCCVGNFDLVAPDDGLLAVLVKRVIVPWRRQFGIPVENIVTHNQFNPAKSCPGTRFDMALLRGMVT